jgi:hypothetical protein
MIADVRSANVRTVVLLASVSLLGGSLTASAQVVATSFSELQTVVKPGDNRGDRLMDGR